MKRVIIIICTYGEGNSKMRIALTGNPNSGKTTMYNALTGKTERVGNWAGVTVKVNEADLKKSIYDGEEIKIVDLPGAYSLSPFTSEESITKNFIIDEKPDVLIDIVDADNLSRSLFMATQLLELGIPMIIALNKSDVASKKGIEVDAKALAAELKCQVIETVASAGSNNGIKELIAAAVALKGKTQEAPFMLKDVDNTSAESLEQADKARFDFSNAIVAKVEKRTAEANKPTIHDKIDKVFANTFFGIVIFVGVMYGLLWISQSWLGPIIADWLVGGLEGIMESVRGALEGSNDFLIALLVDGLIGGFIAVIGFLPLIMVMFFLISLLEDCGYMARVAVVMDRIFKHVGLSGKSVIPMVIGTACAIPGIAASRTIKDQKQRATTAMLTPFMPCGAKLPVIALFAGAFFPEQGWVAPTTYFVGILLILVGALVIRKITGSSKKSAYFIIEMPAYKGPSLKIALFAMLGRAKSFIIKAGTIIVICNAFVFIMQSFDWSFTLLAEGQEDQSILASIASPFALLLAPLGFGMWQLAAAAITGFIAKENVVATLALTYGITRFIDLDELAMTGEASAVAGAMGITSVAALAYLFFNLYTPPCFAAIGSMNAEIESKKWFWSGIALQFGSGYVVAFLVYQIGTLITMGELGTAFVPGLIFVVAVVALVIWLMVRKKKPVLA